MVAQLRSSYGRHVGEPAWENFIARCRSQPALRELWANGDVAPPGPRVKTFRHQAVGDSDDVDVAVDRRHGGVPHRGLHAEREEARAKSRR